MAQLARLTAIACLFAVPFLPLVVTTDLFFPFITGKNFWFRILVEVAFGAWLVLAISDPKYRPRFSWILVLYAALIAWMAVANAFSVNPQKAFWSNYERMDGWMMIAHVFALFLVASTVLTGKLMQRWWLTFIGASALIVGYGLLQIMGAAEIHQGGVRVDASFGNAAYLAAYLLFAIAVTLWQGIESRGWLRYSMFVLAALQVFVLFTTATRGALVGLVGATVIGTFLWVLSSGKGGRKIAVGAFVAVLLIVGGFVLVKDSAWVQNDPTLTRLASISFEELGTRTTIWTMAGQGFLERPITGWGQEGFNYVFNKYYDPSLYAQEPWFDRAHNLYLDWLIAGGAPALLLFLALMGAAVIAVFRKSESRAEGILLLSALAAYGIQGLVVFDNLFSYVPLAMILAVAHQRSARSWKRMDTLPVPSTGSAQTYVAPIVAVLTLALIWVVNVPGMTGAARLIEALRSGNDLDSAITRFEGALASGTFAKQEVREQLIQYAMSIASQQSIPEQERALFYQAALAEFGKQVEALPNDARLRLQYAGAHRIAGDLAGAERELEAALALSPKKQSLHLERGVLALQAKEYDEALTAFQTAYDLDTRYADAAAYVAAAHIFMGNPGEADRLLLQHFGTTTVDQNVLLAAYQERKNYSALIDIWRLRVERSGGDASSRYNLAIAYAMAGRISDAVAEVRATMAAHPSTASQGAQLLTQLGQAQ